MPKMPRRPCGFPGCPNLTDGRFCEECYKCGILTPTEEIHHIVPLSHGGTHADDNLMALCKPCHSRITVEMGDRWPQNKEYTY